MPIKVDFIAKKQNHKENLVRPSSTYNIKIVFILLIIIVILYIRFLIIKIKEYSF